jgi:aminomethyltransferase
MNGPDHIGEVTSGSVSPTLDMNIGMGYVPISLSDGGTRLQIDVRGRLIEAEIVPLPFYSRRKSE